MDYRFSNGDAHDKDCLPFSSESLIDLHLAFLLSKRPSSIRRQAFIMLTVLGCTS